LNTLYNGLTKDFGKGGVFIMENNTKDKIEIIELNNVEFESTCKYDMCGNGNV